MNRAVAGAGGSSRSVALNNEFIHYPARAFRSSSLAFRSNGVVPPLVVAGTIRLLDGILGTDLILEVQALQRSIVSPGTLAETPTIPKVAVRDWN